MTLLGAPDDRGVLNVGGRLGAGHGPQSVRLMLSQFMLGMRGEIGKIGLSPGFDVNPGASIEAGHSALRRAVLEALQAGETPIVIGGGHDYGYPHVAGVFDYLNCDGQAKLALINVDAHLDVRPPSESGITSGSPFFLVLEEGVVRPRNFVEFGIQEHCNDERFHDYASKKGVEIISLDEARDGAGAVAEFGKLLKRFSKQGHKIVVSFDVDAVQAAHAPAVSAPQIDGFTPGDFLNMARLCGECRDVISIGYFELAPSLDEQQRTSRLVATSMHRFLSGFSRRGAKKTRVRRLLSAKIRS